MTISYDDADQVTDQVDRPYWAADVDPASLAAADHQIRELYARLDHRPAHVVAEILDAMKRALADPPYTARIVAHQVGR